MNGRGRPGAYCWSCDRPADVRDLPSMAQHGLCKDCADCSQSRRDKAPETLPAVTAPLQRPV